MSCFFRSKKSSKGQRSESSEGTSSNPQTTFQGQTCEPFGDGAGGAPFIEAGGRPSFLEAAVASDPDGDAAASSVHSADDTGLTCSRWLRHADLSTAPASGCISGVPVRVF
ncbi:hypothetical protein ACLB2K_012720 [Fragaria x ananassa]